MFLVGGIFSIISLFALSCADGPRSSSRTEQYEETNVADVVEVGKSKPIVKVYIENSGSMDGYVNPDFRNKMSKYLSNIGNVSDVTDSLCLNFINKEIISFNSSTPIEDFVDKLSPQSFSYCGGDRASSDISDMLDTICPSCDSEVVVFVSDCIFSPGKGKNASDYLNNQQVGIEKTMKTMRKNMPKSAILIYRVIGDFDGFYYDKNDMPRKFKGERPFYIWLIGSKEKLMDFVDQVPFENSDKVCMISSSEKDLRYAVVPGGGNYSVSKTNPHAVNKAKIDKKYDGGRMVVKIKVDFSNVFQSDDYLENLDNYVLSDKQFTIDRIDKCCVNNFTHIITISSKNVKHGKLNISLKNNLPSWIEDYNDDRGDYLTDDNDNIEKTYGLKCMVDGVYNVFTYDDTNLAEIEISIN